jgi:dTDP-glucose 4,6-dehydratase
MYLPKNLLVTGGAGFIGANFVHYYQKQYPKAFILVLDKLTYAGSRDNLINLPNPDNYAFVHGDIADFALVMKLLAEYHIDTIVHFAAESHVDRSIADPSVFIQTNLVGTYTLLEAARKYWLEQKKFDSSNCRFHHISTDEVYGMLSKTDPPFTESTAYRPNSPYAASKAGSDHLVRAYQHTYGLPMTTSDCSNNYGPYQHAEKFIPTVIRACLAGKPIPIYGDGSNIRDWLYVEDHCAAIDIILRQGKIGETYNIGGNTEKTNLEVVHAICHLLQQLKPREKKYQELISFVPDRPGHDWRYAIDNRKIKEELCWQPKETFFSGLEKTVLFELNKHKKYEKTI